MEKNPEQLQNHEIDEADWQTATIDADETCEMGPPEEADGMTVRSEVTGIYIDHKVVDGRFGDSYLFVFEVRKPEGQGTYNLGVWGVQHMIPAMLRVPYGSPVRLVWQGTKDTGKKSPMKMVKVLTPRSVNLLPPQRMSRNASNEVPF